MLLTAVVLAQQRTGCRQALGAVARMVVDKRIGHKLCLRDDGLFLQCLTATPCVVRDALSAIASGGKSSARPSDAKTATSLPS